MLPTPSELRERSGFYRAAAREATDASAKARRDACSLILAEVAEAIERDREAADAHSDQLARGIVDALVAGVSGAADVRQADAAAVRERAMRAERARINRWRMRAEELLTTADHFINPSAQEPLRRAAATYQQMAQDAEALLERQAGGLTRTGTARIGPRVLALAWPHAGRHAPVQGEASLRSREKADQALLSEPAEDVALAGAKPRPSR